MDNDYELLYLAKEDNEDAIEVLINKYKKVINYKILKYSNNKKEYQEDMFNEALNTLYRSIYYYNDSYTFSTFFSNCLENSLKNYCKLLQEKHNINDDVNTINTNKNNPEEILLEEFDYENLKERIINNLSWKEELIFLLKEQNYTIKEISEITDTNLKSVYTIINRIKSKVSNILSNKKY